MAQSPLRGITALVTGGARRLGRHLALALAGQGANVVVHYGSSAEEAQQCRRELEALGVQAWAIQADLASPDEAQALFPRALELAGPIQVLVNSASVFDPSSLADVRFDQLTHNAAVNAWAPFVLSRALAAQGLPGRIVNLLDTRVHGYDWSHVAYILSKHLLAVLTAMMALEFAPDITVNAVAPGLILPPPGQDETYLDTLAPQLPLRRHGDPEDITSAVLFLLQSRFITGQVLYVDGGVHLRGGCHGLHTH